MLSDSPMADVADIAELDTSFAGVTTILVTWLENYKGPGMVEVEGIESAVAARRVLDDAIDAYRRARSR